MAEAIITFLRLLLLPLGVCMLAALIREALLKSVGNQSPSYWIFYGRHLTVCDPYHTGEKHKVQDGR